MQRRPGPLWRQRPSGLSLDGSVRGSVTVSVAEPTAVGAQTPVDCTRAYEQFIRANMNNRAWVTIVADGQTTLTPAGELAFSGQNPMCSRYRSFNMNEPVFRDPARALREQNPATNARDCIEKFYDFARANGLPIVVPPPIAQGSSLGGDGSGSFSTQIGPVTIRGTGSYSAAGAALYRSPDMDYVQIDPVYWAMFYEQHPSCAAFFDATYGGFVAPKIPDSMRKAPAPSQRGLTQTTTTATSRPPMSTAKKVAIGVGVTAGVAGIGYLVYLAIK